MALELAIIATDTLLSGGKTFTVTGPIPGNADSHMKINGINVLTVGTPVKCSKDGNTTISAIGASTTTFCSGIAIAINGTALACGHTLISSQQLNFYSTI